MPVITVQKLSPAIGAVITGVDLSESLPAETRAEIEKALVDNHVIFFENQFRLHPDAQVSFARNFGQLHVHPFYPNLKGEDAPEIIVLDTHSLNPPDNDNWHTDVTFEKTPPLGCVLRAVQLPTVGGDTCWTSTAAAYNALSQPLRTLLDGLTGVHDFSHCFPADKWKNAEEGRKVQAMYPPVHHPLVRIHPVTKIRGIFAGDFCTGVKDLAKEEANTVLKFLNQHVAKPEFTVRWQWKKGDVAFWDNRLTQHYALADYLPERRIMHRVTIIGDVPFGPQDLDKLVKPAESDDRTVT